MPRPAAKKVLEYAESVRRAADQVLSRTLAGPYRWGELSVRDWPPASASGLEVAIRYVGDLEGQVRFAFPAAAGRAVAGEMLGVPVEDLHPLAVSALCELVNMVTGTARGYLNHDGLVSDITPPDAALGGSAGTVERASRAAVLPLLLDSGTIHVLIDIGRRHR